VAGNRIELDGLVAGRPEYRVSPAGTPYLRMLVDCGGVGEEFKLPVLLTGDAATALKALLEPGRPVRVAGRLRRLKGLMQANPEAAFEVVADQVEAADS
jgi:primosomal replication protein N